MVITLKLKWRGRNRVFELSIGHESKWFQQVPFVTLIEIFEDDNFDVYNAKMIFPRGL